MLVAHVRNEGVLAEVHLAAKDARAVLQALVALEVACEGAALAEGTPTPLHVADKGLLARVRADVVLVVVLAVEAASTALKLADKEGRPAVGHLVSLQVVATLVCAVAAWVGAHVLVLAAITLLLQLQLQLQLLLLLTRGGIGC